jgi:SPP1 gp7 family putative phage head morphogenesis protein
MAATHINVKALVHLCCAIADQHKPIRVNVGKSRADPTGQAKTRNNATRRLKTRLTIAEKQVKKLFRAIPRTRKQQTVLPNAERESLYAYDLSETGAIALQLDIRNVIDASLETPNPSIPPADWWYEPLVEKPYRQGTVEEIRDFNQLIAQATAAGVTGAGGLQLLTTDPADVLLSADYLARVRSAVVNNYGLIKTLSDQTADQVIFQIQNGIDGGNTPTEIIDSITKRFNVSRSNAARIANTEINRAYTDARLDAAKTAAERSGLRAGVLHISALIPTTRKTHAARHGNVYTPDQQRKWWNSGAERINCLCSVRSVLIDSKGKVIDSSLQKEIKNQGAEFFEEQ